MKATRRFIYKLLVVCFDSGTGSFDDAEFHKFCEQHNIIKIEKETLHVDGNIYYSFFIEYLLRKTKDAKPDLQYLSKSEMKKYDRLREWRNELAAMKASLPTSSCTIPNCMIPLRSNRKQRQIQRWQQVLGSGKKGRLSQGALSTLQVP